ncbi:MAG: hypothetical protein ACOX33_10650 [Dethiobacteria bacterium]
MVDIYWMFFFGILGYFFKMYGYPVSTLVLGVILAPIIDNNFRRAIDICHGNLLEFIAGFFTNPISLVLLLFIVFMTLPDNVKSGAVRLIKKPFTKGK